MAFWSIRVNSAVCLRFCLRFCTFAFTHALLYKRFCTTLKPAKFGLLNSHHSPSTSLRAGLHKVMTEFLSQNLLLVAAFLGSGSFLLWTVLSTQMNGSKSIGTLEATRIMNAGNALILDIRENAEFNSGRIPKSKNIPLVDLSKRVDEIARFKEKPVVVTDRNNTRASGAVRALKAAGFVDVYQLQGGYVAWQQASLPIEK
jgi:rhodanese-related sulfurtransferase